MLRQWKRLTILIASALLLAFSQGWSAEPPVHNFHCSECHLSGLTITELGGDNVCLKCHSLTASDVTINPGAPEVLDGHTDSRFSSGDASNAFGHGTGQPTADQTSHNWAVASDILAAAGAQAPARSLHPEFYSRYGTSVGRITCSRCHLPHGGINNPQLLVKGSNSADAMCRACHLPWDQKDNHGLLTHPLANDYTAKASASPDKYRSILVNKENADIRLVDGGVSCTSCHGLHFADSDAATVDGPTTLLNKSDGKLLRGDGPEQADKSSLCQTCHTYAEHGNNPGEKAGCLVCHSGHSYDPEYPNYFVLRKLAATATYNTVTGLDYSSPAVLDEAQKHTFWNDGSDGTADGYCEKCHGDAAALPGSIHTSTSVCTDCHKHSAEDGGSFGHPGGGDCTACHAADHVVFSGQAAWITFFDNSARHAGSESGPVATYATCSMCHTTNLLTQHNSNCIICHFGASPPRESFTNWNETCQQGSCHPSFHSVASDAHDTEYYNGSYGDCNRCHDNIGWGFTWDGIATPVVCGECHVLKADTTPPVSSTDLQTNYIDAAKVSISSFDAWGIQTIYYSLDGGATLTYSSPITVAAPVSNSQSHILEYWARDNSGNVETANSRSFTVTRDITPPVTTSDAKTLYGADATIRLTPTDDATSFPVAATYYKVGAGGTVQSGTTAVIPEPASDSAEHTLYFWSIDHAGNVEDPPITATFTIVANGLVAAEMPMGNWIYGYSDPYASADRVLADPWMSYAIYVDDVLIDTITRKFYINVLTNGQLWPSMPQSWTMAWRCPPGIPVSNGSQIKIIVNAGFSDRALWAGVNEVPATYTITLPEGAAQLESVDWTFTTTLNWNDWDYDEDWDAELSWVGVLPAVENISYVTTVLDTTPPVTTSNAVSGKAYLGATAIALAASDPAGTGVESTWWQLDSTSGTWTQGTSVPVAAPSTGTTKSHTLYWYSRDYAGNQEAVKSVSFSVDALQTVTTSLARSAAVSAYADDGPTDTAWASYTIKLDGTTIGTKTTSASTAWTAPLRDITGAGVIEIVVDAGFTDRPNWVPDSEVPATYTLALPVGAKRLENFNWDGFANKSVAIDCGDACTYDYAYVTISAGTFSNIRYSRTGTDTDTIAPVTTCTATEGATYNGDQAFTLTPSDAGSGVESTWWQLDGSSIWTIGTSVPVVAPALGTASHTLTWYSRDNAANQEAQQSVTFDVQAP
jgi:predicted CXXCH cytochrome family protein